MKRKILLTAVIAAMALSLASCGEKNENSPSQVTGEGVNSSQTTLAPAATAAPDSAEKAQAKVDAAGGETNVTITEDSGERSVNLAFSIENHTGVDFPAILLAPVDTDVLKTSNILGEGMVFANGQSIKLDPGMTGEAEITTTLFNIAAVDADSKGYVFQNIDLSTSNVVSLYIEDGVPKAVIN